MEGRIFVCKVKEDHFFKNLFAVASFPLRTFVPTGFLKEFFGSSKSLVNGCRRKFFHEFKEKLVHLFNAKASVQIRKNVFECIGCFVPAEKHADMMEDFIDEPHGIKVACRNLVLVLTALFKNFIQQSLEFLNRLKVCKYCVAGRCKKSLVKIAFLP